MRDRQGGGNSSLSQRVHERLRGRGVDPTLATWDAGRNEDGQWQVRVLFAAGGRERTASWWFDLEGRSVVPADDEARWLSEDSDEVSGPIPHKQAFGARSTVYDVEAEGGIDHVRSRDRRPDDIETALRASSSRRRRGSRRNQPTLTAVDDAPREDALPLEPVAFDPETSEPPPAARGVHPLDAEPELPLEVVDEPETASETGAEDVAEMQESQKAPEPAPAEVPSPGPARTAGAKRGRRSVPSWDDIMFGPGGTGS
jgi:hypothetical protein